MTKRTSDDHDRLLGFEPLADPIPKPPVPDQAARPSAEAFAPEDEEIVFSARPTRMTLPSLDGLAGDGQRRIRPKPEHPAIRLPVASRDPDAWKLGDLRVTYRGAVAQSTLTKPWRLRDLAPHTLIMGATGSGKTVAMKLHMWSVLRPVREQGANGRRESGFATNFRTLVYDAKTDLVPFFAHMGFSTDEHVILTNPFDARSASWDIARDVSNSADSQAFADIAILRQGGDAFWEISARDMLSAAIDGLNSVHPGESKARHWDLRHLITVMDRPELLKQVLVRTGKGRGIVRDYINTVDRLALSIRATLRASLSPYRLIAALWDRAKYSFSLKRWSEGGGVLLIGDHYKYRHSRVRVNNMLVRDAIDTLMDRHDQNEHDLTWLYLDELKNAGKFPNFGTMLTQGRSKGIRSVLAAQGLSTLKATFEEAEVEEVLNNCGEKAIMQLGTAEDADWAERLFSMHTVTKISRTVPRQSPNEGSETFHDDRQPRVFAREFLELDSASDNDGGLHAFYHWRGKDGVSCNRLHSTSVDQGMPDPLGERPVPPEFAPRGPEEFEIREFGPEDYDHLGLHPPEDDDGFGGPPGGSHPPAPEESRFKLPPDYD